MIQKYRLLIGSILGLGLVLIGASVGSSQLADASWPMFGHDLKHTGRSPYPGVQIPTKKWEYLTGFSIVSSPAIGADGTIYVGSRDNRNRLYAINPDGTKKWEFLTGDDVGFSPAIGADGTIYVGSLDHKLYAIGSSIL